MKLASVRYRDEHLVVVELDDGRLADIDALRAARGGTGAAASGRAARADMLDLIRAGQPALRELEAALGALRERRIDVPRIAAEQVEWQPPVRRPGKICAVAMNNSASNARKISAPDHPAFFLKPASCLIGHRQPIRIRRYYGSVHPEPELAVVVGRQAHDVPARQALDYVFGYAIFNDVTGNGMRAEDRFHYWAVYASKDDPNDTERVEQHLSYTARYKGTDTFGVLGPWLVTRDEIGNPDDLSVRCRVGGETVAEDSTRYYNYKAAEVLSFISYFHTLDAGDVISLGTAFKPAANRKSIHHANFQTVGGPVEIDIDGLGTQHNAIVIEDRELGPWRLS
jgi:2-keto-4-pentenoate hydratase/2-oxohepta-3-ene-1,7-dioic acid hydratase in catechol pathway